MAAQDAQLPMITETWNEDASYDFGINPFSLIDYSNACFESLPAIEGTIKQSGEDTAAAFRMPMGMQNKQQPDSETAEQNNDLSKSGFSGRLFEMNKMMAKVLEILDHDEEKQRMQTRLTEVENDMNHMKIAMRRIEQQIKGFAEPIQHLIQEVDDHKEWQENCDVWGAQTQKSLKHLLKRMSPGTAVGDTDDE